VKALIAVLPGDGVGPEVTTAAVRCLRAIARRFNHQFELCEAAFGGAAIDAHGAPLPQSTLELCRRADAVLLGAIGGPKWSDPDAAVRPEQGLLGLRRELGLYANLRPVVPNRALLAASPLKPQLLHDVDIMVVRELTGGIYFGKKTRTPNGAMDVCEYTRAEVERIVRVAGRLAMARRRRLVSVDKANVLETSRLWRSVTEELLRAEFPQVSFEHMLVDAAAMHLLRRPRDFDVIVTENMFGDILTDEASMLAGSMGLLPSASLGEGQRGLYEPIHGSAPDIAGQDVANPFAAIMSAALLLRHSLGLEQEASVLESAVSRAIDGGARTRDLALSGEKSLGTREATDAVLAALD
jgi:3-isopropylmalate dehydrogenase